MFEIFLFVNPLGTKCYQNAQTVMSALHEQQLSACYHLVPVVSLANIQAYLKQGSECPGCLSQFNHAAKAMKDAQTVFYVLKLLAGNKKARHFIFDLQSSLLTNRSFSPQLTKQILQALGISPQIIANHRESRFVERARQHDQKLIEQFQVRATPTTVIYNYEQNQTGYLFEGSISRPDLEQVLAAKQTARIHLL